jgi:uncharacterized protein (DUF2235 family)
MKRLVFCFDGTSNRLIVENPTNVVLTAESVLPLADDQKTAQLIFYDEGVGTTKGEKAAGILLGKGLDKKLADAYRFLIFNYTPGDEIYIFGFSRGAYTARSFAGLLANSSIPNRRHADQVDKAIEHYRAHTDTPEFEEYMMEFRREYCWDVCVSDKVRGGRQKTRDTHGGRHGSSVSLISACGTPSAHWECREICSFHNG